MSKGVQTINVDNIIGMTRGRHDEYDDNLLPIGEPDDRWKRIYEKAKEEFNVDFAGPIRVVKVPNEDKYFVYDDGNHRVSVAKALGIPTIQAEVIELVKGNNDYQQQKEDIMNKIKGLNEQIQKYTIEQQKLYDSGLSISEADLKFEEIEHKKESFIEEADKLWLELEKLQQQLT